MDKKEFYKIIDRYLKGEATEQDINTLQQFEQFAEDKYSILDSKEAKENTYLNIQKHIQPDENRSFVFKKLFQYAAMIAILISVSFFSYFYFTSNLTDYHSIANTTDLPLTIPLDDGSKVTLNKNASISYKKSEFNIKDRALMLEGNAFFEVAKNPTKPFIVTAGDLKTKVLGTSFDIDANNNDIKVTVTEGKVAVYNKKDTLNLLPNQQALYSKNMLTSNDVNAQLYNYWTKENITLENITMGQLTDILSEIYEVDFEFENEEIKQSKMTLSFNRNDELLEVIKIMNMINNNLLEMKNNDVILIKDK